MRNLGLLLLFIGVGLAAAFGSQLSPKYRALQITAGEIEFVEAKADFLHAQYCTARGQTQLAKSDGCGDTSLFAGVDPKRVQVDAMDNLSVREARQREINLLQTVDETLDEAVFKARSDWLDALRATTPFLKKQKKATVPQPVQRLKGWWASSGWGFGLGIALLVIGSVVCRIAARREMTEDNGSSTAGPQDFGVLLGTLCAEVDRLSLAMGQCPQPTEGQLVDTKHDLEELQQEMMERLVQSGPKLQMKYGLSGFASVFSPLSAGERLLNRTWSTLVDRHWPEAQRSVANASIQLNAAQDALTKLKSAG